MGVPSSVCIIDGYNMIHRCRFEWGGGLATTPNKVIYNFFRTLRSAIDSAEYDYVYFVTEGVPSHRLELDKNYKANRVSSSLTDEEVEYWAMFREQKRFIIDTISSHLPISVVNHPLYEGDDVIYSLIKHRHASDDVEIISSDTDFIQVLNEFPNNVKLYNPIGKVYRENTPYDYVSWKAMVGDRTDNVPGVPRIGKKTATKILTTPGELDERKSDLNFNNAFNNSYGLIKLSSIDDDLESISFSESVLDSRSMRESLEPLGFSFVSDDASWERYIETFFKLEKE